MAERQPTPTARLAAQTPTAVPTVDVLAGITPMPTDCVLPEDLPVDPAGNPQPSVLPEDAQAASKRADVAIKQSDWMKVVAELSTVVEVADTHAISHSLLGRAYLKLYENDKSQPKDLGNLRRAFHYLYRGLALDPNNMDGHYNIAHAYGMLIGMRADRADAFFTCEIAHATRAIELSKGTNATVYKNRGHQYFGVPGHHVCLAKADFEKALEIAPGYEEVYYFLGQVYADLGDWDQAMKYYELTEQSTKQSPEMTELKEKVPEAKAKLGERPATPQITTCP